MTSLSRAKANRQMAQDRKSLGWCRALGGAGGKRPIVQGSWAERHAARMAARSSTGDAA